MPDVFKIAEILVAHAMQAHQGEIAIIAYAGSHAKGRASPMSDLDIFYIPDKGKANSLSSQFIIDSLPYDFWGMSWEFAEDIANAKSVRPWAVAASLIADAKVLYHRSLQDLDRFHAMQNRIANLTKPSGRTIMIASALDEFQTTLFQLGQLRLAVASDDAAGWRWAAWKFVNSAVNCLALVNQTYFDKGWGANFAQMLRMQHKPSELGDMMSAIVMSQDTNRMLAEADRLAREVRDILRTAQASLAEPAAAQKMFKDFYYFVVEYKQKVLSACERDDVMAANYAALQLQQEICILMNKVYSGFYGTDFNLLGEYVGGYQKAGFPDLTEPASRGDLAELAVRVQRLDAQVQVWFRRHAVELNILDSEAALDQFLSQRDPGQKEADT